jgi:PAS domain S-box-containing protein
LEFIYSVNYVKIDEDILAKGGFMEFDKKYIEKIENLVQELKNDKSLLKKCLDILPINIYIRDYKGTFIYLNDTQANEYNRSPKQLLGKNLLEDFKDLNQFQLKKSVEFDRKAIEKQEKTKKIDRVIDVDGNEIMVIYVRVPFGTNKVMGLSFDITEEFLDIKKLSNKIFDSYLLHEKMEDLFEFASGIHQVKPGDEKRFWSELLTSVMKLIPKADYGSCYTNHNGFVKFIATKGHNKKSLNKLEIDSNNFSKRNRNNKVIIIKDIVERFSNESYYEELLRVSKPIKETLTFKIYRDNKLFGGVSIDLKKGSKDSFDKNDKNILEIFLSFSNYFYKSKQYSFFKEEFTKELGVTLIKLLEFRDKYTEGHSQSVALLAAMIAKKMNLPKEIKEKTYWAGLLHDIGKISIPEKILNKPGKLTNEEYKIVKKHPRWSYESICNSRQLNDIAEPMLYHHERWDGKGYPDGLKGNQIPLISQILGVADSWDAMVSKRVYKKALTKKEALKVIKKNKGTQFSPEVVEVFIKMVENKEIDNMNILDDDKLLLRAQREEKEEINKIYFKKLFEESKEAIVILNKEFRILTCNKYFEELFDYKQSEVQGVKIKDTIIPQEKLYESKKFIKQLKNKGRVNVKTYRQNKKREKIDVSLQAFTINLSDGNIGYYVIYNDISEFKDMENKYKEAEDKYRALFKNEKIVMLIIDPDDGKIIDANPAAEKFYGWSKKELTSMKISDINVLSEKEVKKEMKSVVNKEKVYFDFRHKTATSGIKGVRVYSQPIKFGDKDYLYSIICNNN